MSRGRVEVVERVDATTRQAIEGLLAAAERADGHRAMSEEMRLLLEAGTGGAISLVGRTAEGEVAGYGQLVQDRDQESWTMEAAVHPAHREREGRGGEGLVDAALAEVARRGGGTLRMWLFDRSPEQTAVATERGFELERELLQLRAALPLPASAAVPLAVRAFRPGEDESAWLAVNRRAFATHPEQGRWREADVLRREREPWFDPAGFLLHEEDGVLAGFCWTKVHRHTTPPMGEIYVIGVDPAFQGKGLGRALTVAGLDHLAAAGLTTGMLYVDGDNTAARALYRSLGFQIARVDRAYVVTVRPPRSTAPPAVPDRR